MTPTQWFNTYNNTFIEYDGSEKGSATENQCVDSVKCYLQEVWGVKTKGKGTSAWGMAKDYYLCFDNSGWGGYKRLHDAGFVKIPNTLDMVVQLGDVVVWKKPSRTGHIAVGYKADNHTIQSYDQNYGKNLKLRLVKHDDNYDGVLGVLRPPHTIIMDVNVRAGSGTSYKLVKELKKGTKVTVYETFGNWSRIGNNMWISSNFIDKF